MAATRETVATTAPAREDYLSYEDFLAQYDGVHAEWVDGEVELMSPIADRHDKVSRFLNYLVGAFVEGRKLGQVKQPPSQTRLGADLPGREPDLMFIAQERLDIIKPNFVDGPPDLVIEIVSPESRARDYGTKADEYERAGVREYWIIDPQREDALFYQRDEEGIFRRVNPDADGRYHAAALPGFALDVALLWRDPLPTFWDVAEMVRGMGGAQSIPGT